MTKSLKEIIRRERATYYDFSSNTPSKIWSVLFLQVVIAFLFGVFFSNIDSNSLRSIMTVYSILIGFSFSVLFFLANSSLQTLEDTEAVLERVNDVKLANAIRSELFDNVSYFIVVGIIAILIVIISIFWEAFSVPDYISSKTPDFLFQIGTRFSGFFSDIKTVVLCVARACFYFSLIHAIAVFIRIVVRVNFYFTMQRKLEK